MGLTQNLNRIDHVVMMVREENLDACVERLSAVLGVEFEYFTFEPQGLRGAISLESGLEVITPLTPDSVLGRQLEAWGEGLHSITFGVPDVEAAKERAEANGMRTYGVYDALGPSSPEFIAEKIEVLKECHFREDLRHPLRRLADRAEGLRGLVRPSAASTPAQPRRLCPPCRGRSARAACGSRGATPSGVVRPASNPRACASARRGTSRAA